jgi:hypothetical protein
MKRRLVFRITLRRDAEVLRRGGPAFWSTPFIDDEVARAGLCASGEGILGGFYSVRGALDFPGISEIFFKIFFCEIFWEKILIRKKYF